MGKRVNRKLSYEEYFVEERDASKIENADHVWSWEAYLKLTDKKLESAFGNG